MLGVGCWLCLFLRLLLRLDVGFGRREINRTKEKSQILQDLIWMDTE